MTNTLNPVSVAGTDGITPIYQPGTRWTIWRLTEVYTGQQGQNRYVPNVHDYVVDTDTFSWYEVDSVDPTTMLAELVPINRIPNDELSMNDRLLGVGPGTQSDTYRVYIDKSVQPFTLAVDARLCVAGTMVKTAQIFRGSLLDGSAKVISAMYDQSGNMLGQAIPLETVAYPNNAAIKTVPVCYTTEDLPDGEIVTAVFYSDVGHVVSKRQLLVENTAFIRSADTSVKYITSIDLESPFLSSADPSLIQYPLNVPLAGLSLMGVVNYSDGSSLRMPVDNTKFSIFGFEKYVSTIIGQKFPLVLKYSLSQDEVVYGANATSDKFITKSYKATTTNADGAYTVKLFGYPVWVDAVNGYTLEWYLYNLERNVVYHVTPYVKYNANNRPFSPLAYGVSQSMSVSVNLQDVNGIYPRYIHVQTEEVALFGPGTERTTNWTVSFDPQQDPPYGRSMFASTTFINQNLSNVNIGFNATSFDDWLKRIYANTKPLIDYSKEINPPVPDHFALVINGTDIVYPISQWNSDLILNTVIPDSGTLFVKLIKRLADTDLQLSIAALPVYQTT